MAKTTLRISFSVTAEVDIDREDYKDENGNQMSLLEIQEQTEEEIRDDLPSFCNNYDYSVSDVSITAVEAK